MLCVRGRGAQPGPSMDTRITMLHRFMQARHGKKDLKLIKIIIITVDPPGLLGSTAYSVDPVNNSGTPANAAE